MTPGDQNLKCTILVSTNTYGKDIKNPYIILII